MSSSSTTNTLYPSKDGGEDGRNVSTGESSQVCVPTSRISERYIIDSLPHELNPFSLPVRRASREIPLDVYIAYISLVSACVARNLRALRPRIHPIMYPNWRTSSRACLSIGEFKPSDFPSIVISIETRYVYNMFIAV